MPDFDPINAKPIVITLAVVVAFMVFSLTVLYGFYRAYIETDVHRETFEPVGTEAVPFDQIQREKRDYLHSYGWISREEKIVHIPIDEAITLVFPRTPGGEP